MLKVDKIRKKQAPIFYIIDYLWGGLATLAVCSAIVACWQLGSLLLGEFLLPPPMKVFVQAVDLLQNFARNQIDLTLWRALIGVGSSVCLGILCGLIAGYFKTCMALLKPLMTLLLSTPPIIWVVMVLFWFGFGHASVLFTIVIIVFPLTFANAAIGMATVNKQDKEVFDAHQLGLCRKIRYLYLPHLTSYVIASLNIAVASGVRVVVMAELLGANDGIGARIADARAMLDTTTVLGYVCLIIGLVALFEYLIIKPLEILFMPWRR